MIRNMMYSVVYVVRLCSVYSVIYAVRLCTVLFMRSDCVQCFLCSQTVYSVVYAARLCTVFLCGQTGQSVLKRDNR